MKVHEPVGVIGIACPDNYPLLGFVSLFAPAVIRGNAIIIVPSEKYPLSALDLYQVNKKMHIFIVYIRYLVLLYSNVTYHVGCNQTLLCNIP